jgi:hypothetical protein
MHRRKKHASTKHETYSSGIVFNVHEEVAARGVAVGWGTPIQAGISRVRFPIVLMEFFIDIILTNNFI